MTDKELIHMVHSGDKGALNTIIAKYYDDIYRFCYYLTGHEIDSYDITQEVFVKFIRYADSYRYKNLKGYLLIIARNLCYDYFRSKKDEVCLEEISEVGKDDIQIRIKEDKLLLEQALKSIPPKQREVIILRIYEGYKFKEIAKMLGCNISTVKSRYTLGIKNMGKEMENGKESL
ncbi:MAG: RNA polymerase sigma factor [Lachnospiraceae bacterium]|nr:RNA polymerase sigma factor [Lachnospiraceae bacterium]